MTTTASESDVVRTAGDHPAVLVVDDDQAIRTLVSRILERASYEVGQAANGEEAIVQLRAKRYRAVLLDLMMPLMSGSEVVNYLDTHDDAGTPSVLVISAAAERDLDGIASPLVHAVLRKPFDLPVLLKTVERCIVRHCP